MSDLVILSHIQVRRDTTKNWLKNKNVIPKAGEPCLDTDTKIVVYGDGKSTYGALLEEYMENNRGEVDLEEGGGLEYSEDSKLQVKGIKSAEKGAYFILDSETGEPKWVKPSISFEEVESKFEDIKKELENVYTKDNTYSKEEVDALMQSAFKYQGAINSKEDLEEKKESAKRGDIWYVEDEDQFYIYNGEKFEDFSSSVELSGYVTKEDFKSTKNIVDSIPDGILTGNTIEIEQTSEDVNIKFNIWQKKEDGTYEQKSKDVVTIPKASENLAGVVTSEILEKIEAGAESITNITINGETIISDDRTIDIPVASENPGVVTSSDEENKISVAEDGTMEVNSVNINKIIQSVGDFLVLDGGSADNSSAD